MIACPRIATIKAPRVVGCSLFGNISSGNIFRGFINTEVDSSGVGPGSAGIGSRGTLQPMSIRFWRMRTAHRYASPSSRLYQISAMAFGARLSGSNRLGSGSRPQMCLARYRSLSSSAFAAAFRADSAFCSLVASMVSSVRAAVLAASRSRPNWMFDCPNSAVLRSVSLSSAKSTFCRRLSALDTKTSNANSAVTPAETTIHPIAEANTNHFFNLSLMWRLRNASTQPMRTSPPSSITPIATTTVDATSQQNHTSRLCCKERRATSYINLIVSEDSGGMSRDQKLDRWVKWMLICLTSAAVVLLGEIGYVVTVAILVKRRRKLR